jgi:hypothetical protein
MLAREAPSSLRATRGSAARVAQVGHHLDLDLVPEPELARGNRDSGRQPKLAESLSEYAVEPFPSVERSRQIRVTWAQALA